MAYRVRIRLYVIGPADRTASVRLLQEGERYREGVDGSEGTRSKAGLWQQMQAEREHNEGRQEVILRLIAAYRQFHIASGAYFVPRPLSAKEARRLISAEITRPGHGWHQAPIKPRHLLR